MTAVKSSFAAPRSLVLLGASNLARGLPAILTAARAVLGAPLQVYCAQGHGRSYGQWSRVLGRSLPGIGGCGLWRALEQEGAGETYGVLTDIGNDLMYGAPVSTVLVWVESCLERLASARARTVVVLPPLARLELLRPWEYRVAKALLFPGRPLAFHQALDRVRRLEDQLRGVCCDRGVALVAPPCAWYGVDPIHLRSSVRQRAWRSILASLLEGSGSGWEAPSCRCSPLSLARRVQLRIARPEQWRFLGAPLRTAQPWAVLDDGSTLSLY